MRDDPNRYPMVVQLVKARALSRWLAAGWNVQQALTRAHKARSRAGSIVFKSLGDAAALAPVNTAIAVMEEVATLRGRSATLRGDGEPEGG